MNKSCIRLHLLPAGGAQQNYVITLHIFLQSDFSSEQNAFPSCWSCASIYTQAFLGLILFSVPHIRHTRKGDYPLTDPRDIYEAVANQAARRVRACILGIIPSDVVEAAVDRCNKTLREGYEEPLVDRVRKMAEVFEKEFSVNISMIEKYLGCKSDAFSENDFVRLKKVYRTLRDGMAKREDYFEIGLPVTDNSEISDPFSGGEKKQEASKEGDKK